MILVVVVVLDGGIRTLVRKIGILVAREVAGICDRRTGEHRREDILLTADDEVVVQAIEDILFHRRLEIERVAREQIVDKDGILDDGRHARIVVDGAAERISRIAREARLVDLDDRLNRPLVHLKEQRAALIGHIVLERRVVERRDGVLIEAGDDLHRAALRRDIALERDARHRQNGIVARNRAALAAGRIALERHVRHDCDRAEAQLHRTAVADGPVAREGVLAREGVAGTVRIERAAVLRRSIAAEDRILERHRRRGRRIERSAVLRRIGLERRLVERDLRHALREIDCATVVKRRVAVEERGVELDRPRQVGRVDRATLVSRILREDRIILDYEIDGIKIDRAALGLSLVSGETRRAANRHVAVREERATLLREVADELGRAERQRRTRLDIEGAALADEHLAHLGIEKFLSLVGSSEFGLNGRQHCDGNILAVRALGALDRFHDRLDITIALDGHLLDRQRYEALGR